MSYSIARVNQLLRLILIGLLPLTFALNSSAQRIDRIDQMEKELLEIKLRLTKLEAATGKPPSNQNPAVSGEGASSLSNWRKLQTNMSPAEVRALLGEPTRIDGGTLARWSYSNGAEVTFMGEKVYRWSEPQSK